MPASIDELCARYEALKTARGTWDSWCQDLGEVVSPRKAEITTRETQPSGDKESKLYNTTAVQCNMTMAHGQMSYAMPFSEQWFRLEPPANEEASDASRKWYSKAGEIMAQGLANSNFYTEAHEACLDRSGFGTGLIYCEESLTNASGLRFDAPPVGRYSLAENNDKLVDTVFRDREMTARQLEQEFGQDTLPKEVLKVLNNRKDPGKAHTEKFTVVHGVYPRKDYDSTKVDSTNMPYASCYFMPKEKAKLRESGYEDNPYKASRYLKWGSEVYGWCPGWQALSAARQLNMLERLMDGMAEVALYPRMLIPSTLEGNVGLGAGDVTIYNPFNDSKPEEWGYNGRYEAGTERLMRREQEIRDAYHYDLFKMFSTLDKQMTAREVMERASEKLVLFSPTFVRMQEEWLQPILQRVFRIYLKQGKFPEPPEDVVALDNEGPHIQPPKLQFTSRVALAIRQLQSQGLMNMMEVAAPMIQVDPSTRHIIKIAEALPGVARNMGVPEEWISTKEEFEQKVQADMQAAQAQQQMSMAAEGVNAASKLDAGQIDAIGKTMAG